MERSFEVDSPCPGRYIDEVHRGEIKNRAGGFAQLHSNDILAFCDCDNSAPWGTYPSRGTSYQSSESLNKIVPNKTNLVCLLTSLSFPNDRVSISTYLQIPSVAGC